MSMFDLSAGGGAWKVGLVDKSLVGTAESLTIEDPDVFRAEDGFQGSSLHRTA